MGMTAMNKIFSGILVALMLMVPGLAIHAAGSAAMSLDQGSYEVQRGSYVDVTVSVDPRGELLDTVRVVLTYDPTVLSAQSVRLSGDFERSAPGNYRDNAGGKISWGAFTLEGPVTSPSEVITVTFLGLTSGDADIRISSDSRALNNGEEKIDIGSLGEASVFVTDVEVTDPGAATLVVQSASHADEAIWYSNRDVTLSWTTPEGESPITAYIYSFGLDADEEPNVSLEASTQDLSLQAAQDGLHYFRIKGVQEDGRETAVTQRLVRVDTTEPNPIELTVQDDKILEGESAWFTFATTDETSGVAEYQVAINESEFQAQTSPLEMEDLPPGTYFFRVAAFDRAGNIAFGAVSVRVYPTGTDLQRPDGYEEGSEVRAIQAALTEFADEIFIDPLWWIIVVLGAIVLFGIIIQTRKRKK